MDHGSVILRPFKQYYNSRRWEDEGSVQKKKKQKNSIDGRKDCRLARESNLLQRESSLNSATRSLTE